LEFKSGAEKKRLGKKTHRNRPRVGGTISTEGPPFFKQPWSQNFVKRNGSKAPLKGTFLDNPAGAAPRTGQPVPRGDLNKNNDVLKVVVSSDMFSIAHNRKRKG